MQLRIRGDALMLRCEGCAAEFEIDAAAPLLPQLSQVDRTHDCAPYFPLAEPGGPVICPTASGARLRLV
jgi:hypothetical protein